MSDKEISMIDNAVALQHYKVTMSRHELSAIEMRIMAMIILKIKDAQINGYNEEVKDTSDLWSKYNEVTIKNAEVTIGDNHSQVRKALRELRKRDITLKTTINGKQGELYTGLIREARYSNDASEIKLDVSPDLLPELIELGKNYTKFGLEFLFKTKSAHAIRWYQIGSHWLKNGVFYISKDEVRELFKAEGKYDQHVNFQRLLITQPVKEVNAKSDIKLAITKTHKKGRSVVGYTFSVARKSNAIKAQEQPQETPDKLQSFANSYWQGVQRACKANEYPIEAMRDKIKQRGVKGQYTNDRHFFNATIAWIASILAKDGNQSMTKQAIADLIRQKELEL